MAKKPFHELSDTERKALKNTLQDAYDFNPRDPLFGLSAEQLRGPTLSRRVVLRLLAAAGVLSMTQLLPSQGSARAQETASRGGTLNAGWAGVGEIRTLDPAQINQVLQFQIASNVLGGLTHINPDLVAEGDLATDWTVSEDGLLYTFNLRQGVTFHNGDPFTAEDVLFTYNRSKDPQQSIHSRTLENVVDLEALDEYTVRFTLQAPQASFLVKALERSSGRAMTIVNQRAIDELGLEQYGLTPVSTGPFRVTEHQLGQRLILEAFEDYYDPERPMLERVIITPIIEPEPLAAAIEANDIQLIGGNPVAAELVDRFVENDDLVVDVIPGPGFQSMFINPWREPFRVDNFNLSIEELLEQPGFKVRLALAKAIDREDFINRALFGRGLPAFGTINAAMGFFFDQQINETSQQRFDASEAQRLLAEAGFPNGEGFPTLTLTVTPAGRREGLVLADILRRNLGITVELDTKDFPVLIDNFDAMNFDILRLGSGGDFDPDDAMVDWLQTDSSFNGPARPVDEMPFGYFSDAEVDTLIQQQRIEPDLERRRELVQQANALVSNKVASAFLFHPLDVLVHRQEVNFPAVSRIPGLIDLDRVTIG